MQTQGGTPPLHGKHSLAILSYARSLFCTPDPLNINHKAIVSSEQKQTGVHHPSLSADANHISSELYWGNLSTGVHACNPSAQEAEEGRGRVQSRCVIHNEILSQSNSGWRCSSVVGSLSVISKAPSSTLNTTKRNTGEQIYYESITYIIIQAKKMKFIYLLTSFLKVTNIYAEIVYFCFLKKVTLLNLIPSEFLPKSVSIT